VPRKVTYTKVCCVPRTICKKVPVKCCCPCPQPSCSPTCDAGCQPKSACGG
jgi:hypothetical protein